MTKLLDRVGWFTVLITSLGLSSGWVTPGWAAILVNSEATSKLDRFSHLPLNVQVFPQTNTKAISRNGSVSSTANADAVFLSDPSNLSVASTMAQSQVSGQGSSYLGVALSVSESIGRSFLIKAGETFSFAFETTLNLDFVVDRPSAETAIATGNVFLGLYDSGDAANLLLLDTFAIAGYLETPGKRSTLDVTRSEGITLSSSQTEIDRPSIGTRGTAAATIEGTLSRYFANPATLTVVSYTVNQAIATVPEPSSVPALLLLLSLLEIKAISGKESTRRG